MSNSKRTIESLMEQGKASGKLSTKEITDVLEELEYDVDQMEAFYDSCSNLNIEIIEDFNIDTDLSLPLDASDDDLELSLSTPKEWHRATRRQKNALQKLTCVLLFQ